MNFFKQLSETGVQKLELKVVVKDDVLSVIIIPEIKNENVIPLTVSGTAEELDEGFFGIITAPLQKVAGLSSNVEAFEKSLENKPAATSKTEKSDAGSGTVKNTAAAKEKAPKKTPPYKHQKYLDAILQIVNAEGYVLTHENKDDLYAATSKLLVMDSKNEVALEWEKKIKELPIEEPSSEEPKVEEKPEPAKEDIPVVEEKPAEPEKKEESKVEEKVEKKPTPPPANEDFDIDDDDEMDLDFDDFFGE